MLLFPMVPAIRCPVKRREICCFNLQIYLFVFSCESWNHTLCARIWSGDVVEKRNYRLIYLNFNVCFFYFRCLSCRQESTESLMRHDQHYLESLEEDESEFLGLIESYEAEQEELLRERMLYHEDNGSFCYQRDGLAISFKRNWSSSRSRVAFTTGIIMRI